VKRCLLLIAAVLPLAATAQTIWRCGPDGRTYSSTPCAEGRVLETLQARPAEEVAEARERAAREQQQADSMARSRLAQDARQRGNGLAGIAPPPELKPMGAKPSRQKVKKHQRSVEDADTWRATAPSIRRTKG